MVYRAIGVMSGSSLDGLDIVFAQFEESRGAWSYEIKASDTYEYNTDWQRRLQQATNLSAYDYLKLHADYGKFTGEQINSFIQTHELYHQVQIIASHGHTVFHAPGNGFTAQLGDGAHIAAVTGINVVSDLRTMDVALGGQGAPIVPAGEKLLFAQHSVLLNIGGIANITYQNAETQVAFDICPANKVLNALAEKEGKPYDEDGEMASAGVVHDGLLWHLNEMDYYALPFPKSLDNSFGLQTVLPVIESYGQLTTADASATYVEHIVMQTVKAIQQLENQFSIGSKELLITGGGAFHSFLIQRLRDALEPMNYTITIPPSEVVKYKEALIMALLGLLRWREENTVLQSVTGASRSSIGGAVWIGQDA
ncbi:MAG: anhydro-N-acetylmuramic acid kinase [Williamsia sp.]|nr:anhydro-N-acetylmuramic acid kinase [Williamsia sp.]